MRINWMVIHKIARWMGRPFRIAFEKLGVLFMPDFEDIPDYWSGFHALAGALIANFVVGNRGLRMSSYILALVVSFLWMVAYEVLVDGLKIEDVRGASESDIGYDLMGATLSVFFTWLGRLV